MSYFLTATSSKGVESVGFDADSDTSAVFAAMGWILEKAAADNAGPWAVGEVILKNTTSGEIVQTMESKEGA